MIDQQTEQIAHENDKKHEKDMHRLAPGIEKQACDEQENIFQNFCIPEKRVVEEQYDRQEYELGKSMMMSSKLACYRINNGSALVYQEGERLSNVGGMNTFFRLGNTVSKEGREKVCIRRVITWCTAQREYVWWRM